MASKIATKLVLGRFAQEIDKKPVQRYDPDIVAAAEAGTTAKKWQFWKKKADPETILSTKDRKILRDVRHLAKFLDRGLHCCCFWIGFDGIVGLIPIAGDFVSFLFSLYLVRMASHANLPDRIVGQMLSNVFVDFVIGLVPLVGDMFDIMYKCNWRNYIILEDYLLKRRKEEILQSGPSNPPAVSTSNPPAVSSSNHNSTPESSLHSGTVTSPAAQTNSSPPSHSVKENHTSKKEKYGTFVAK